MFNKILIIGVGLLGGSIALRAKEKKLSKEIYGFSRGKDSLDYAIKNEIIDGEIDISAPSSLKNIDLCIICSPIGSYEKIFKFLNDSNNKKMIITDIGSIKEYVDKLAKTTLSEKLYKNFVPAHPIAGSEKSGIEYSDSNLFNDRKLIICSNSSNKEAIVRNFWEKIGSNVSSMKSLDHDHIYACMSHIPQYLSFKFREFFEKNNKNILQDKEAERFIRISTSNKEMWRDIFANSKAFNSRLRYFIEDLDLLLRDKSADIKHLNARYLRKYKLSEDVSNFNNSLAVILASILICSSEGFEYAGNGFLDFTSVIYSGDITFDYDELANFVNYIKTNPHI